MFIQVLNISSFNDAYILWWPIKSIKWMVPDCLLWAKHHSHVRWFNWGLTGYWFLFSRPGKGQRTHISNQGWGDITVVGQRTI